jgi:hypothetical protein
MYSLYRYYDSVFNFYMTFIMAALLNSVLNTCYINITTQRQHIEIVTGVMRFRVGDNAAAL